MDRLQSVSTPAAIGGETFPDNDRIPPQSAVAAVPREGATGRFAPGNPGRARGLRNKASLARDMIESESEMLVAQVLARALSGDAVAQRVCITRILPPRRELPVDIDLPAVVTAADALTASSTTIRMVGEGRLTPSEGHRVVSMIAAQLRVVDAADLEARARAHAASGGVTRR